jgi:hypothetical protein
MYLIYIISLHNETSRKLMFLKSPDNTRFRKLSEKANMQDFIHR